jgi:hypothetical protein
MTEPLPRAYRRLPTALAIGIGMLLRAGCATQPPPAATSNATC